MDREHREIEATLYRLIEQASTGVLILEPDWTVRYRNPAAARMLGREAERGQSLLDLLTDGPSSPPQDAAPDEDTFVVSPRGDGGQPARRYSVTLSALVEDGRGDRRMLALVQSAPDPQGSTGGAEAYLAHVSHKLLTPLAAITANLSILRRPDLVPSDEDRDRTLSETETAAVQLREVISQVVAMAEIRPAEHARTPASQLAEIVEIQVANVSLSHPETRPKIQVAIDLGESCFPLSGCELETVVGSLLDNALKFCGKPEPAVRITASASALSAMLRVEDDGRGIEPADQERVFDRFFQSGAMPAGVRGPGLGLSLVKKIVGARGGRVSLRSTPGEGTEVRIEIPFNCRDENSAREPAKSTAGS